MTDTRFDLEEGGGGIDGFTGHVTDANFQEGEYGTSLRLVNTFDDPENYVQFDDGTFTMYYPCGKGWTTLDMGETVTHETGDPAKRFRKDSKIGQLVAHIAQIPDVATLLPADWSAYQAASWKGLHLVWGRVQVPGRKQIDGVWTDVTNNVLMPVAFGGQTAAAGENGAVDVATLGLDQAQIISLAAVAQSTDTPGKFIEALASQPAVMQNMVFMGAVGKDAQGVKDALAAATF